MGFLEFFDHFSYEFVGFVYCSVGDYAVENGGTNSSSQFKNLEELVKILDAQLLSKLDGSSQPSSSSNSSR
jgi:hypothetical protein